MLHHPHCHTFIPIVQTLVDNFLVRQYINATGRATASQLQFIPGLCFFTGSEKRTAEKYPFGPPN